MADQFVRDASASSLAVAKGPRLHHEQPFLSQPFQLACNQVLDYRWRKSEHTVQ